MCYAEVSNGRFTSCAGGHNPLHISPPRLAPTAPSSLGPNSELCPAEPALSQHFPLHMPCATMHYPACLSLPWVSSLLQFPSPIPSDFFSESSPLLFPTCEHGVGIFGTQVLYTLFFTKYQFIKSYKYRTRAHNPTKHASSGCFPAYKILISSKLYMPVGKVQHPVGNPTWLLSISFFFPACNKLHYVKIYRAVQYFDINLPEES